MGITEGLLNSKENEELLKLYESKWEAVKDICTNNKEVSKKELGLLLTCVPNNYSTLPLKVLSIGHTNGWRIKESARECMLKTLKFSLQPKGEKYPPFRFSYKVCKALNDFERKGSKKSYFTWVEFYKFAYLQKPYFKLKESTQALIDKEFNFLKEEVKIINPNVILVFTPPSDDEIIIKQLSSEGDEVKFEKIEGFKVKEFAKISLKSLSAFCFRIAPQLLKKEKTQKELLKAIKKALKPEAESKEKPSKDKSKQKSAKTKNKDTKNKADTPKEG